MAKFNICIIKPENYIHSFAFIELSELIHYSLLEIGHQSLISFNNLNPHCRNIIIGCHLLNPNYLKLIPKSSIILNTEQIYNDQTHWNENIFFWARKFETWDYSRKNIEKFNQLGISSVKLLKIGYQKELNRISEVNNQDIDILFYGSINERRKFIIDNLIKKGLNVKVLFGIYGKDRDEWISRSKITLNHHHYNSEIFEVVRVSYLITNSVAVVCEINETTSIDPLYMDAIYPKKYDELVDGCIELVNNETKRINIKAAALNTIKKYPQSDFTLSII